MAFLVFEGIDGSGKSLLLSLLSETLQNKGLTVVETREPGGTEAGKKIREALLAPSQGGLDPLTETLLCYADRKQNLEERIKPALKKKSWLLSDRYWASTAAYQAGGRGVATDFVEKLRQKVCAGFEPDLWILLDLPVETALKRLWAVKKDSRDRLEREGPAFHQKVRDYYLKLAHSEPSKWLVLDARQAPTQLLKRVLSCLRKKGFLSE